LAEIRCRRLWSEGSLRSHIATKVRHRLLAGSDTAPLRRYGGGNSLHIHDGAASSKGTTNLLDAYT
jgi:hypothetical protein